MLAKKSQPYSLQTDEQSEVLHYTQTEANHCNIVEVDSFCFTDSILGINI
jgi:hypothetical protein